MLRSLVGIAILGLISCAPAQISKKGNAYLMRTKYTKGVKLTYQMTTKANIPGMANPMDISSPVVMFVKDAKKNVGTIEMTTGPVIQNGQQTGKSETQTIKMDAQNRLVAGKSGTEAFASFAFPTGPVKVGQTWKSKLKMGTPMGEITLDAVYKFVGVKTVGGKSVAEIGSIISGSFSGKVTGKGTTLLLVSDGTLLSSHAVMNMALKLGSGSPQNVQTTSNIVRK